jgi:hypothetical protein
MKELLDLIKRFQDLKNITGTNKSSSYSVNIHFDPWEQVVEIELGGYDVGDWSRLECISTTKQSLLFDLERKIIEAEQIVAANKSLGVYD